MRETPQTAEKDERVSVFDLMSDPDARDRCGGCQGLGSHRRWCRTEVGLSASIYGPMSERLGSMGDTVGPNNYDLANRLWALSGDMRKWAEEQIISAAKRGGGQ